MCYYNHNTSGSPQSYSYTVYYVRHETIYGSSSTAPWTIPWTPIQDDTHTESTGNTGVLADGYSDLVKYNFNRETGTEVWQWHPTPPGPGGFSAGRWRAWDLSGSWVRTVQFGAQSY